LAVLTAEVLEKDPKWVLPFSAAIEFVHSYSLIHDDLPLMDNDDFRRGQPTNHKVYGEDVALLAGDGLLTEAFHILAQGYKDQAELSVLLVSLVSEAAGFLGMVGGQALDIAALKASQPSLSDLDLVHQMKTGALIAVSIEGAALICQAKEQQVKDLTLFGQYLGLAFQLADDLLDHDPSAPEGSGFPKVMGVEETQSYLRETTKKAIASLEPFGAAAKPLLKIAEYNQKRLL
jgi:geranylgeranyl diphosphate synthase type II